MLVSKKDRLWIRNNQLGLHFDNSGDNEFLIGYYEFFAAYDEQKFEYIINPRNSQCENFICISDKYNLIILIPSESKRFPKIWEIDNRIIGFAQKRGLPLIDLHIYEDGEVCLVGPLDMSKQFSFLEFINGPVLQFFYDQSYYQQFGRWPRGQYSHGLLGLFENFCDHTAKLNDSLILECLSYMKKLNNWKDFEKLILSKKRIKGHYCCPCGSRKKFRRCHEKVFRGMWNLQKYLKNNPTVIQSLLNNDVP